MESGGASRTAVFVCQGRAAADGRLAVGRFADPIAAQLLTPDELRPVDAVRRGERPADGRQRFLAESVAACAEAVVPRTVRLDELVAEALARDASAQLVLLGAGLDARPWRLAALAATPVFSVDHPATQADMRDRCAPVGEPLCDLRWVPVDLERDPLTPALAGAGHDPTRATIWVWEGVVQYLREADVATSVATLAALSAPGSTLLINYRTPSLTASFGRVVSQVFARIARAENVLADEPWHSAFTPDSLAELLDRHGFAVRSDEGMLEAARRVGSPTRHSRSLATNRLTVATR